MNTHPHDVCTKVDLGMRTFVPTPTGASVSVHKEDDNNEFRVEDIPAEEFTVIQKRKGISNLAAF